ncbi:MAG: isoprenylcysteine carboxylmethyltransferase family protein [Chloroflexota bacterium]|nr:isoprenylcysteine carboxylmethyltransferase family protein [Chloroflexota bacterium]
MIFRILIWIIFLFGGSALGIWLDLQWFPALFTNLFFHLVTLIVGILMLRLVVRASRNTGRALAKMGREGDIPRMETDTLVTTGFWECMRHPMHFALLFFPLSVALILGSPTFILILATLEILIMLAMIKFIEEPEAIIKFGDAYREYQKQVPMFNLRPECWLQLLKED